MEKTWKGPKVLNSKGEFVQIEKKLVDMSLQELREAQRHCKTMLFNSDPKNLGRKLVLDMISEQIHSCGAELFVRYVEECQQVSRITLINTINDFLKLNKGIFAKDIDLSAVFKNLSLEFCHIPLSSVIDACLDGLGVFNKNNLTRAFILRMGVWFTPEEIKDLANEKEIKHIPELLEEVRERLKLKDVEKLKINSKGLNYNELRAMIQLRPNKKFRDMTSTQLKTLRNKVLFLLKNNVNNHVYFWEEKLKQVEELLNS